MNGDRSQNPLFIFPSERIVEINAALNGTEGPKIREFAFKVEEARKNVYAMLQAESDEDVLLKEIDQYIDGMLMNKNLEQKNRAGFHGIHPSPSKAINQYARYEDMKNVPYANDLVPEDQLEFSKIRKDFAQISNLFKKPSSRADAIDIESPRNGK